MRNLNNFLPLSLVASGEPPCGSRGLRTAAGNFNLDFQRLALDQGPCLCVGAVLRPSGGPLQESKTDPETVTVNQFSVQGDICVLFFPTHPGMDWPWISGPETELVDKSGFHLNRSFFGVRCSLRRLSQFWGNLVAPSQKYSSPKSPLSPPSRKGISPGLKKTGVERYFRPWDRLASPLSVPSPKQ